MKVEDWQHIESLFHTALRLNAEERPAYLVQACSGNELLRGEVESLLIAFEKQNGFMEEAAFDFGMKVLSDNSDASLEGEEVGSYKISMPLGKGGMGNVYLAEDTRLGRKVALKFLSNKLVDENWHKRQLIKEAQAVAMLEHPNICAIYGFEETNRHSFIVMQYVAGETLAHLIHKHSLDIKRAISFAIQMTSALSEAHAHGIIHCDIKPQNIMVAAGGHVKVLDFGLAKIVQRQQGLGRVKDESSRISRDGLVVGTVAYMSPEQLRAERLDFRSDIFSLGVVLYEMFSEKNPHARGSTAETISAILTECPAQLTTATDGIPQELNRKLNHIVLKCLEKNKDHRYQSASEILLDLQILQDHESGKRGQDYKGVRGLHAFTAFTLFILVLIAGMAFAYFHVTKPRTLAVLPIINVSADPGMDYLSAGLTEGLINKLSGKSHLRVKAPTVVSGYKGQEIDPQKIGRVLDVDAVLLGRLTQQGEMLVLNTNLVNTKDGTQLWGETNQISIKEIPALQDELSEKITSGLRVRESGGEQRNSPPRQTQDPEAFRRYMLGRYYWNKRDHENIQRAITHFQEAIEIDPIYARAYAGLADSYVILSSVAYGSVPTKEAMLKARAAAKKAIEIDDALCEAHTSLGVVKLRYEWNWLEAESEFKRAIELNPDYAPAHYWYSSLLAVTGRMNESIAESELAMELDPFSPLIKVNVGRSYYFARRYDSATRYFVKLLQEDPNDIRSLYLLGLVYQRTGRYRESAEIFLKIYNVNKLLAVAPLGYAYGKLGREIDAQNVLAEMDELSKHSNIPPQERAMVYIGLGNKDEAFVWLEKAYEERFASVIYLTAEPLFDSLRTEPRFFDLARRINLTP